MTTGWAVIQLLSGFKAGEGYKGVRTPWPDAVGTITSGTVDAWSLPEGLTTGRQIAIAAAGGTTHYDVSSDLLNNELGQ